LQAARTILQMQENVLRCAPSATTNVYLRRIAGVLDDAMISGAKSLHPELDAANIAHSISSFKDEIQRTSASLPCDQGMLDEHLATMQIPMETLVWRIEAAAIVISMFQGPFPKEDRRPLRKRSFKTSYCTPHGKTMTTAWGQKLFEQNSFRGPWRTQDCLYSLRSSIIRKIGMLIAAMGSCSSG
jgi:hypothetical protein